MIAKGPIQNRKIMNKVQSQRAQSEIEIKSLLYQIKSAGCELLLLGNCDEVLGIRFLSRLLIRSEN